ncbi:hypothetical protein ACPA0F_18700 [Solibacillus silvestris]
MLGNCPECGKPLWWSSDYEDSFDEYVFFSAWYCNDCDIEVIKRYKVAESEDE